MRLALILIVQWCFDFKTAPDYETDQRNYTITVTSSDGTNTSDQTITVTIDDVNDNAPVFTSSAAVTIEENKTAVTTLTTTDADTNPTVTYSITGGADASSFAVTEAGVLTISGTDYESGKTSYEVIVTANDGLIQLIKLLPLLSMMLTIMHQSLLQVLQ